MSTANENKTLNTCPDKINVLFHKLSVIAVVLHLTSSKEVRLLLLTETMK